MEQSLNARNLTRKTFRAISLLVITGIAFITGRILYYRSPLAVERTSVWQVDLKIEKSGVRKKQILKVAHPWETRHVRIVAQQLIHPKLRIRRSRKFTEDSREIIASTSASGKMFFKAQFQLELVPSGYFGKESLQPLNAGKRTNYLEIDPSIDLTASPIKEILESISEGNEGFPARSQKAFDYLRGKIRIDPAADKLSVIEVLKSGTGSVRNQARALVLLCRSLGIPARVLMGVVLSEEKNRQRPHYWVEAFDGKRWVPYDPSRGFKGDVPANYVPFRKDDGEFVTLDGEALPFTISMSRPLDVLTAKTPAEKNILEIVNLTRLPYSVRSALWILLLLPFGALITIIANNVFRIRTFGTFTPTLIGLSAVYADWLTASVIFIVVAVIGFGGRAMLPGLELDRKPRLGIVFLLVALSMTASVSLMYYFGHFPEGYVVLLPIVVLTSFIDKAYKLADKAGPHAAMIRTMWTAAIAFLCFSVFRLENLGRLMLRYPEIHLFTIAMILFSHWLSASGTIDRFVESERFGSLKRLLRLSH